MGSWGELPWESDAGLDFAWNSLEKTVDAVSATLRQPLLDSATPSDIDRVKVCCDLLLKLRPYWNPFKRRVDVENAIVALARAREILLCWENVEPNTDRMLQELRDLLPQLPP